MHTQRHTGEKIAGTFVESLAQEAPPAASGDEYGLASQIPCHQRCNTVIKAAACMVRKRQVVRVGTDA
jgi:hypothetical protein